MIVHDDAGIRALLVQHDVEGDGRSDEPTALEL
jgi:hypothetical protein